MARSAQDRRDEVLRAIVTNYVQSGEPVGSKTLVDKHDLGVSPATVRNDMSALEEAGYIYQPHTSAGRVPTQKGYRAFVDQIAKLKPLSSPERKAIETFLAGSLDQDDLVDRTVRLLAQLTNQLAVVQYPSHRCLGVRHIEIVPMGPSRILLVIITTTGDVEQRMVETDREVSEADALVLRVVLNEVVSGVNPAQLRQVDLAGYPLSEDQRLVGEAALRHVCDAVADHEDTRIVMAGTANLVRAGGNFTTSIGMVLDALEEQVALLRLFTEAEAGTQGVSVTIGTENQHAALTETALVSGTYGTGDTLSHLGVIGPTRMDYAAAMTTVGAVARYVSHFLTR